MIRDIPLWLIHQVAMSSAGTGRGKEAAQVGFRVTGSQSIQSARPLIRHAATAHRLSCLSYIAQLPPRNPCSPFCRAKSYHAFDFWANKPASEMQGAWSCDLPPVSCRILALRARENHPVLVSTSRHVTQGIIDVESESWDAASRSLQVRVHLTAEDPNELRIAGLADGPGWSLARATVAPENTAAGVEVECLPATESGWRRVRLLSPASRTIAVTLCFAPEETTPRLHPDR